MAKQQLLAGLCAVLIVLSSVTGFIIIPATVHTAEAASETYDINYGFEDGSVGTSPPSWTAEGQANTFEVDNTKSYAGAKSVHTTESASGRVEIEPDTQPSEKQDQDVQATIYVPTQAEASGSTNVQNSLFLSSGSVNDLLQDAEIFIEMDDAYNKVYVSDPNSERKAVGSFSGGEWFTVQIYDIDLDAQTYSVSWESDSASGSAEDLPIAGDSFDGWDTMGIGIGNEGWFDEVRTNGAAVTGFVTEPDGTAVEGAEVKLGDKNVTTSSSGKYTLTTQRTGKADITARTTVDEKTRTIALSEGDRFEQNFTVVDGDIGGQVVACPISDQTCDDPAPVAGATVQIVNYNTTAIEENFDDVSSLEEARQKAEDLDDKLGSYEVDDYTSGLNPANKYGDADEVYPVVHPASDWMLQGFERDSVVNRKTELINLSNPRVEVSSEERLAISLWDPTNPSDGGLTSEPGDENLPGSTTSGTVKITQLGPDGEFVRSSTEPTTDQLEVSGFPFNINSKVHEFAEVSLEPGYYKVSAQDSDISYVIKVGDPQLKQVVPGYVDSINDEKEDLNKSIQQAETLTNLKNNESVIERRVTTDENGNWMLNFDSDNEDHIDRVGVAAAKTSEGDNIAPGLSDPGTVWRDEDGDFEKDIISEFGDARDAGYNGSIYLPSETRQIERNETVTLELTEISAAPFSDENLTAQRLRQAANLFNATADEIRELWDIPSSNYTADEFDDVADRYNETRNQTAEYADDTDQSCAELINDLEPGQTQACSGDGQDGSGPGADDGFDTPSPDELTDQEMIDRLRELEQMIAENSQPPEESGDAKITNNTLSGTFTVPGDVDSENVSVLIEHANGTVRTVNESHYTVEETVNPLDGEEVVVEGVTVSSDDPNPTLRVDAVVDEGGLITDDQNSTTIITAREDVINPAYPNSVPQLEALDVNTLTPGSDQRVVITPKAESDSGFNRISNATVYGPSGEKLNSSVRDLSEVRFTTNGTGTHVARIYYENNAGDTFVEKVPLSAANNVGATPPTIRLRGNTRPPIAGDGLSNAQFEITQGSTTADVTAELAGQTSISELHIRGLADIPHDDINVSIKKSNSEMVRKHVSLVLYRSVDDSTLLYRNDDAFSQSGGDPIGSYDADKGTIRTFTASDGTATVKLIANPSRIQRLSHWVDRQTQGLPTVLSMGPVLGLGLFTVCRRWWV